MAWIYLVIAGVFEWGWPVGLKLGLAETGMRRLYLGLSHPALLPKGTEEAAAELAASVNRKLARSGSPDIVI